MHVRVGGGLRGVALRCTLQYLVVYVHCVRVRVCAPAVRQRWWRYCLMEGAGSIGKARTMWLVMSCNNAHRQRRRVSGAVRVCLLYF